MERISRLENEIRDYVNENGLFERHFLNHEDDWHALCVAMDTLGDSAFALLDYEGAGFGSTVGERYLRLYGFLQAVILQQDSIEKLAQLLANRRGQPRPIGWANIRDVRNLATGHPLDNTASVRGTSKRVFVSRATISRDGFTLLTWDKKDAMREFRRVDLSTLYSEYKEEALAILQDISSAQKSRWPREGR